MPWRSRSLTIAAESSNVRSVNSGVICGAVTRIMMKAKKPMSVTVTATMAAIRAAPNDLMNWTKSCTLSDPLVLPLGKNCLVHGYCLVKIRSLALRSRSLGGVPDDARAQVLLICYDGGAAGRPTGRAALGQKTLAQIQRRRLKRAGAVRDH